MNIYSMIQEKIAQYSKCVVSASGRLHVSEALVPIQNLSLKNFCNDKMFIQHHLLYRTGLTQYLHSFLMSSSTYFTQIV